jgi:putative endonuclease
VAVHNDLGQRGEAIAKAYLLEKGHEILFVNYRYAHLEADIISRDSNILIFIEVKTRTGNTFGDPEEFVGYAKQKNLQFLAERYMEQHEYNGEIRFDIISILFGNEGNYKLRHLEDAFWPGF